GASAQRIAGLGFALLVSPLMTLLLGAHAGVVLVNVLGLISSTLIMPRVWRDIDWSMFRWLSAFAVFGSGLGIWLATLFSPEAMSVGVGLVVILALGSSLVLSSGRISQQQRTPRAIAGFTSGLTNALAGVGGPAVSAYAVLTRWPAQPFAATLQPFFVLMGALTATTKLVIDPHSLPPTDWWFWPLVVGGVLAGIWLGERLLGVVSERQVRLFVIFLAFAGATATLIQGLIGLLS
ncbi:sulfite exporter TauE/SafE family protein, partial [Leucobacter sp. M11]|uniref:sulfite exporter TauE/SafE family protein n=1 Tax=Leucobacter sp. M11 TaxID=2993565 RepID=UPI002D7EC453